MIDYKIRPIIQLRDQAYWLFNNEIIDMSLSEILDGIDSCKLAIDGIQTEMNWGGEVSKLRIRKEVSILEYHGEKIAEFQTSDICDMLVVYKDAIIEYEKKYGNND